MFALLFVVSVVSVLFVRDELDRLKGDLVAALTYTMNWHLILGGTSYFDQFQRPPLLRHLWSLAVEEQFYLLWPLLLVGLLVLFRKRPDRLFSAMLGLALCSTVLMALLYGRSTRPAATTAPTPASAASCSAAAWPSSGIRGNWRRASLRCAPARCPPPGWRGSWPSSRCACCRPRSGAFLYRGGFLLVDLASLAVIAAIAHPGVRFGRKLGHPAPRVPGRALVQHLPLALAGLRPDPPRRGHPLGAGPGLHPARGHHARAGRPVVPPGRGSHPQRCHRRWTARWKASEGEERSRRSRQAFLVAASA